MEKRNGNEIYLEKKRTRGPVQSKSFFYSGLPPARSDICQGLLSEAPPCPSLG